MATLKTEKKAFSVFDVFLILLVALAVSLGVYFRLEMPYGIGSGEKPVYQLKLQGTLEDWEEDVLPAERQKLLDENGAVLGRITSVKVLQSGSVKTLSVVCEWEGDLPGGLSFRLETAEFVKQMDIANIIVIREGNG